MRLNGAALNSQTVNGIRRGPLMGDGSALLSIVSDLPGSRVAAIEGSAAIAVSSSVEGQIQRFLSGGLPISVLSEVSPSVLRHGTGAAPITLEPNLYYSRDVFGAGAAMVGLYLDANVGVVFIDGSAATTFGAVTLDGNRIRHGAGDSGLSIVTDGAASAVRRFNGYAATVELYGDGEASHVHDGVRYVGAAGFATMGLYAVDDGMRRQANIGAMQLNFAGSGDGIRIQTSLKGDGLVGTTAEMGASATRKISGTAMSSVRAECDGAVLVPFSGDTFVRVSALCNGSALVFGRGDLYAVEVISSGAGSARVVADGSMVVAMSASGIGRRTASFYGTAVIDLLEIPEGYLNIGADDSDGYMFSRPATDRVFSRGAIEREWRRQ